MNRAASGTPEVRGHMAPKAVVVQTMDGSAVGNIRGGAKLSSRLPQVQTIARPHATNNNPTDRLPQESLMKYAAFVTTACLVGLAGCQSTGQQLDAEQQQAVSTAVKRVSFDMNCPSATGQVLSRQMVAPVSIRFGVERAEYTVGVEGCGQRQTIVVVCPQDGSGCFAGGPRE